MTPGNRYTYTVFINTVLFIAIGSVKYFLFPWGGGLQKLIEKHLFRCWGFPYFKSVFCHCSLSLLSSIALEGGIFH